MDFTTLPMPFPVAERLQLGYSTAVSSSTLYQDWLNERLKDNVPLINQVKPGYQSSDSQNAFLLVCYSCVGLRHLTETEM